MNPTDPIGPALLVLACSRRKSLHLRRGRAWDIYDGPLYQVLKKLLRGHPGWESELRVLIVSARHGLLEPDRVIDTYDERLDDARALRARAAWAPRLRRLLAGRRFRAAHANLGRHYREALPGLAGLLAPTPIEWATGGIGARNAQTRRWVERQLTGALSDGTARRTSSHRPSGTDSRR